MQLIIGLGNPGKEYSKNRHNIGFIMLDSFCDEHNYGQWKLEKGFFAEIIKQGDVIFCKPQTYMNKSGDAVKKICDFYKIIPEDCLVVYDEIDLPTGKIQEKVGGSHAGHNGIKSILHIFQQHNTFTKIRIGIGRPATKEEVSDWVLGDFSQAELHIIKRNKDIIFSHISNFLNK